MIKKRPEVRIPHADAAIAVADSSSDYFEQNYREHQWCHFDYGDNKTSLPMFKK